MQKRINTIIISFFSTVHFSLIYNFNGILLKNVVLMNLSNSKESYYEYDVENYFHLNKRNLIKS